MTKVQNFIIEVKLKTKNNAWQFRMKCIKKTAIKAGIETRVVQKIIIEAEIIILNLLGLVNVAS